MSLPDPLRLLHARAATRRQFLAGSGLSIGAMALNSLMGRAGAASVKAGPMIPRPAPVQAKAKAIIYLHMSGAPPALDLFDFKPELKRLNMQPCPDTFLKGQRFAFIKGVPKMLGSPYEFKQHGQAGGWFSSPLPHMASIADD